eukprot:1443-Pleurochrysis_carterae.AAC.1
MHAARACRVRRGEGTAYAHSRARTHCVLAFACCGRIYGARAHAGRMCACRARAHARRARMQDAKD